MFFLFWRKNVLNKRRNFSTTFARWKSFCDVFPHFGIIKVIIYPRARELKKAESFSAFDSVCSKNHISPKRGRGTQRQQQQQKEIIIIRGITPSNNSKSTRIKIKTTSDEEKPPFTINFPRFATGKRRASGR